MIDTKNVGEFLEYAQPALILDKSTSPADTAWQRLYKWRRMKEIADGDVVDREEHEEHVYEGHMNARDLGEWLLQWDDSWRVWAIEYDCVLVNRYVRRPLSEAEIEGAVRYIEQNPEPPEQAAIEWRLPQLLRTDFSTDDWT